MWKHFIAGTVVFVVALSTSSNGIQGQEPAEQNVEAIISHISQSATLYPGDVIYTGTPGTTSAMQPGDVIEIDVEGVEVLRNTVAEQG